MDLFPGTCCIAVAGLLGLGVFAERRLGLRRYLGLGLAGHLVAVLGTAPLFWLVQTLDPAWGQRLRAAPLGTPWFWLAATAMAATVRLPVLWRRRVWTTVFPLVIVVAAFTGRPQDFAGLVAMTTGLVAGAFFWPGRLRRAAVVGSRDEVRTTTALLVTAVVVGMLLSLGSQHLVGPLASSRFLFAQVSYSPAEVAAICENTAQARACIRGVYVLQSSGVGTLLLSVMPLLAQLVLALGLRQGRRAALIGTLALQGLIATLGAIHFGVQLWQQDPFLIDSPTGLEVHVWPVARLAAPVQLPLLVAALVLVNRRAFAVKSRPGAYRPFWTWVGAAAAGSVALTVIGGLLAPSQFLPEASVGGLLVDGVVALLPSTALTVLTPVLLPDGPMARILLGWVPLLPWVLGTVLLLRHMGTVDVDDAGAQTYRSTVREVGTSAASLAWIGSWPGNVIWTSPTRRAAIAYRAYGGVALTTGDPICTEQDLPTVVREFAEHCAARSLVPALYSVHSPTEEVTSELGWFRTQVAEETVLPLGTLAFRGKKFQDVRTAINRAGKEGITAQWTTWAEASLRVRAQIREISEAWVAEKSLPEMGFTLGGLNELADPQVRLLLAVDEHGTLHGVTSWLPVYDDGQMVGLTLDFMRRRDGGFRPVVEFLIAKAAVDAQDEGLKLLSLSGAPLAHTGRDDDRDEDPLEPVLDWLGKVLEPAYGFRSLHNFKAKFQPEYDPMYLCLPDPAHLGLVGRALTHAYLPDAKLMDFVRLGRTLTQQRG